jgi:DNA-binding beta-propeller fold protein YncE
MLFVEMQNHVVRRVDRATGVISTIAGTGAAGFSGDGGPATKAQLSQPHSIALDNEGRIYICDIRNHRIRVVDPSSGGITTFAGTGDRSKSPDGASIDGTALNGPRALDFDGDHSLYLALREGNAIFRIDLKTRTLHHLAGTGRSGYSGDGGPAREAQLAGPKGVSLSKAGDLYFADTESHTIRVLRASSGIVETVIGNGQPGDGPDGSPLHCRLNRPHGVYMAADGSLYVGDSSNHRVRKLQIE